MDNFNTDIYTTKFVVQNKSPIIHVYHYEDGSWQFNGSERDLKDEDYQVISLGELLEIDRSIIELKDLPLGFEAIRSSKEQPWKKLRMSQSYKAILEHLYDPESRINIIFYLVSFIACWYFYSFKVTMTLVLMLLSIYILTHFLLVLYMWIRGGFRKIDKEFVYSGLFAIVVLPLIFFTLDKQLLGYILALTVISTGIGMYNR